MGHGDASGAAGGAQDIAGKARMRRGAPALTKLIVTLGTVAILAAACTSARQQAQPPEAQPQAQPPAAQPQPQPPAAQPQTPPPVVQANPKKARQAEPLVEAVKRYYAANHCYPEMAPGARGMPPGLEPFLHVPWPSGFVYETNTRGMGWQTGRGTVYNVDIYYPGDTPGWNAPGSGRVFIAQDLAVQTC